jgi:GGDEF domain-containing protein
MGRRAEAADVVSRSTEQGLQEIQRAGERGWGDLSSAILRNPRAVMSVVARSIGATAPTLAASAVPVTRLMTAAVAGSGSALTEQGFTVLDVMRESGVDTTNASDVSRFLRNKEAMAAARSKAVKRGIAVGTFDALTAGFAGRLVANSRRSVLSVAPRVVGEGLVQAGGGAAGEATAQLATEGKITDRAAVGLEAAAEVPTFLAEGRGQFAEARRAGLHNADRFNAQSEQSAITKLVTLSSESKTRARSAKRFESLIQSMTTEGEDTVYVPAEAMRTLFQSAAEGEQHPLAGLVSPQDVNEAIATGGEIAIPLAQYATYMTPEQHAAIADQVRLQPGGRQDLPSASAEEIQQAIADGLAEAQQQEERENGPAGQVYDEIYGQLLTKQGEKLARQNASVVQSVYRNLAERVGMDAKQLFDQFRINIPGATRDTRGAPRGVDTDVDPLLDALRSGKLPTDDEIVGEGLASALVRAGGLRADDGGELTALEANRRPGLVTNTGMSLDDALVWAHQQGFIDEAPTQMQDQFNDAAPDIQTFLDLLGRDLAGQRVGRSAARNVKREAFRADAMALQEELDARGVDLAETDNQRAREALGVTRQTEATTEENDQREAEGLPRLYQSAVPELSELEQLRARVAELERELRTDRLTGLRNQRAFEEDEALGWTTVAAADMDGLKRLNDSVGHEAADEVLRVLGGIMLAEENDGARFYRRSGDEFAARFRDRADADRIMADLQARLEEVAIDFDVTGTDGTTVTMTYEGIGISYGNGQNYAEADAGANANKAERLRSGVREEARADGQPRRLQPRRLSRWGEGRRAGEGQAGPQLDDEGRTLNQSAVTDTPEFRAWFGDSKVVGANGEPLVVYHGSPDTRFVDEDGIFKSQRERYGFGKETGAHWFASSPATARSYMDPNRAFDYQAAEPGMVAAYLKIKNPLIVDAAGAKWRGAQKLGKTGDIIAKAQADGHDGVIIRNVRDNYQTGVVRGDKATDTYLVFDSKQIKSADRNRGTFDPNDPSILNQSERGSVTFRNTPEGRQFDITLLAGMDASTFMHEMGHVYLEVLNDLSARDGAPQQIKDDVATIDAWLKREAGQPISTEQHEQFARGFEAYLREGKAPTSALRRAFAAFKVWLTAIYRSATALNVELTDEVRGVFDRIVASDAEIAEARQEQYLEPLIGDALAVGMSAEDFARYNAAVLAAQTDAEAVVAAELLRAMQIEQRAWYREERKRVQAEVTEQMREAPAYRAQRLLRTGKLPDGTEAPDVLRIKLDKEDLLDRYGQDFLRNLRGTYSVEGGVPSDEAADILGFRSGAELVNQLVNAPPLSEAIRAETDARMKERHPDPLTDGTLPDRAMVAAHRDRQADVMVREIRALEGMNGGRPRTEAAVVKGIAAKIIAGKKLRALQPATYKAAEAKAGREAFEAASRQQWAEAAAARRRQLLNFELWRQSVRARNEATATARYLAKFSQTKTRARLGKARGDYLEQIDALLDRFDFRKITDKAADRRASLAAWVKLQTERGIELDLPEQILDEAFRLPFREMTVEQLQGLRDTVRTIDHLARLKGKLLLGNEVRDAAEIDAAMAASVRAATAEQKVTTGDKTKSAKVLQAFRQGRVMQATASDLARELDGFEDGGAVWRNTVGVIRDAVNNQVNPELRKSQQALAEIYLKHYTKAEIRDFSNLVPMPEVNGDLWSRRRLLALALNWGNQGNREAILSQEKAPITKGQADALLGRLDARDWAFVQDVWALVDSYWPAISEAQKRRTGLSPEKVEASPFIVRTSDGQTLAIPGGYYPLKYENDGVKPMKEEVEDAYKAMTVSKTAKAATRRGHTIERVGSGGRTVALDTRLVQSHLRDVIRDLYLGDAVNYVNGVLNGSEFIRAVEATGQAEYAVAMEAWLRDVAVGEIGPRTYYERAVRAVRRNFTVAALAFKPAAAALQITGLVQSSVVLKHDDLWQAGAQFITSPKKMTRYVRESSQFMRVRMDTHVEAVQEVLNAEAGRFAAGQATMIRFGYWMMGRVQQQVDVATWLAAEAQGMRLFDNDVDKARQYADDLVARAQSSSEFIDKSPLQRGNLGSANQSELVKGLAVLSSYMLTKGNAAYQITRQTNFRSPTQAFKWAANMVMLFTVEALIGVWIRGKWPDDDDDEDGDGMADEILALAATETLTGLVGSIPGGGVMTSELRGYDATGVVASAWGEVYKLQQQAEQGEIDRGLVRAAVNVSGVTMGLPSAQINKTIDAVTASADGEDVSPYEYLTGPSK